MEKSRYSDLEDEIIKKIEEIQLLANPKYWKPGIFPNYRFNKFWFYRRNDNSIFYTASIVYILQEIMPKLSGKNQQIAKNIINKAIANYPDYQNKDGLEIYNFYPTKPSKHFAYGLIFRYFKHFQLPDDSDDTALIYLTNIPQKKEGLWLQKKLSFHANAPHKTRAGISEANRNLPAFSTWFGKSMPIEFDTVVHSNILYTLLNYNVELNENSLASWEYIKKSIISNDYQFNPFIVSHNYANSIVIAYHVTKLISKFSLPEDEIVRKNIQDFLLVQNSNKNLNLIEKAMVITSLSKLKVNFEPQEFGYEVFNVAKKYSFFLAGMLSAFHYKTLQKLAAFRFFHIRWQCEAHSLTLLLEAIINLKKK